MHNFAKKAVAGVRAQPVRLLLARRRMAMVCWPNFPSPFYHLHVLVKTDEPAPGTGYPSKPNPSISGTWVGETIAQATTARQAITIDPWRGRILQPDSCPQTICQCLEAFDNLLPDLSLKDNGLIAFTGLGADDSGGSPGCFDRTQENAFRADRIMSATNQQSASA